MTGVTFISKCRKRPPQRVIVAMSGGVDSSVAAAILKEEGHEVIGVTLKLQDCHEARGSRSCCGIDGITRARAVAGQIDIPHYIVDCVNEFEREVLRPAWNDYVNGRTPSPCLLCNERIKFGTLLLWSKQFSATRLATGHYARAEINPDGKPVLLRGIDSDKDQSYFLSGLSKNKLLSVVFPVGNLNKKTVRDIARSRGLSTAETHDSQDACLVNPDQSFAEMLRERFDGENRPGLIINDTGQILGRHSGIHQFTVGQRKGISIPSTSRHWVKAVRTEDSAIVVTDNKENLCSNRFVVMGLNWLEDSPLEPGMECEVQVRYRHHAEAAQIEASNLDEVRVAVSRPVRAITPGQTAVFYNGTRVLGRGWIHAVC